MSLFVLVGGYLQPGMLAFVHHDGRQGDKKGGSIKMPILKDGGLFGWQHLR